MVHTRLKKEMEERARRISGAVGRWLANEGGLLEASVEQTVTTGLFPRHDVQYALQSLRETVHEEALFEWINQTLTRCTPAEREQGSVLCLHAGNLPLVGVQDVLATLLSGERYLGKLSSKDPWLMDGLLRVLREEMGGQIEGWSTSPEAFSGAEAGRAMFSGAASSVQQVIALLLEKQMVAKKAPLLARTARFSVAWLSNGCKEQSRSELVEAIMRYEGQGCRSVAVVVAPDALEDSFPVLKPQIRAFLKDNRPYHPQSPGTAYWKSYLKSVGKPALKAGPMIFTDDPSMAGKKQFITWIQGGINEVESIASRFGKSIQNIYLEDESYLDMEKNAVLSGKNTEKSVTETHPDVFERLSRAQKPNISWKPDGEDALEWLLLQ
ncbi:hypothetical protein QLX67_10140 [Balneolaceae bacterium ANBcel3]|nr:hypothetical protein [Balneolaceae bacterium ANBcel3]